MWNLKRPEWRCHQPLTLLHLFVRITEFWCLWRGLATSMREPTLHPCDTGYQSSSYRLALLSQQTWIPFTLESIQVTQGSSVLWVPLCFSVSHCSRFISGTCRDIPYVCTKRDRADLQLKHIHCFTQISSTSLLRGLGGQPAPPMSVTNSCLRCWHLPLRNGLISLVWAWLVAAEP